MTNANIVTIAGRPHHIRCPQTGRTDVFDCCKPMVAFMATMEERTRCANIVCTHEPMHPRLACCKRRKAILEPSELRKEGK